MTTSRGQSGPQNAVTACAGVVHLGGDAGQQRRRVRSAQTDEVNRATVVLGALRPKGRGTSRWSTLRWAW